MDKIVLEKIEQAKAILNEFDIDLWLTFVRESHNNPDPVLDLIYGTSCTWQTALMITRSGKSTAIVGSLDVANTENTEAYDEVVGYVGGIKDKLLSQIKQINPNKIAVNYSVDSVMADGLSHGMWLVLQDYFQDTPYADKLISSEKIISALRGRKSEEELKRISSACDIAQDILHEVTDFLKPGISEQDVANFIIERTNDRGLELAWDPTHCPAVFSGPDTAGAHASPTERKIERGHIINIDFGVKVDDYCSDLQRTWYMLKENETEAPDEVTRGFNTIVEAIAQAANELKPGKQGYEIDAVARNYITERGYEEYPHGLGHQVGRVAHDGGAMLGPLWERYGDIPRIPVEAGNVFTIEPRLTVDGYGIATVEEEVVVTEDGCRWLSKPQKEIYLVKR